MENTKISYFAAANTYCGFVSYFDKTFPSEKFDRIFVLKGGPGTGKSSLMRRLSAKLSGDDFVIQEILCSSDPKSLDGVIAEKNNKRFAIIDGTSPHERDAIIPGAIDEIINLGNNWDERWLTGSKEQIVSVTREKKNAYQTAYNYLRLAGENDAIISKTYKSNFDKHRAKVKAENILSDYLNFESGREQTMLYSSFGRFGDYETEVSDALYKSKIHVTGEANLFLSECLNLLRCYDVDVTVFPSAKDPQKLDAILLNSSRLLIMSSDRGGINANDYISVSTTDTERIRVASEMHRELILEAKRWFNIAAQLHFSLEEIYSKAMDFTKNDEIMEEIYQKILNISEKG